MIINHFTIPAHYLLRIKTANIHVLPILLSYISKDPECNA